MFFFTQILQKRRLKNNYLYKTESLLHSVQFNFFFLSSHVKDKSYDFSNETTIYFDCGLFYKLV